MHPDDLDPVYPTMADRLVLTIKLTIKQSRVDELRQLVSESLLVNIIPLWTLRKLVGKISSLGSVLFWWRLFMQQLYAALFGQHCYELFHACRPSKLDQLSVYIATAPLRRDGSIITDASPWDWDAH
eukprot:4711522-Amphidinium_carterae.1